MPNIRNVAIIAHVDHGKTTLVDSLLRQSKTKMKKEVADNICIMDSNAIERERGITIFSKNASVEWNGTKINIIDTPGHADFGGEVERVLSMAGGALLLVDAKEGPMPQTRFVLQKALEKNLKIIVVINKIDKADARLDYALDKTFDLFVELGASNDNLDFPVIYASGRDGKAGLSEKLEDMSDISPIFEAILKHIPEPNGDEDKPLQISVSNIFYDNFKGRIAVGRIHNGKVTANQDIMHIDREGQMKKYRLMTLLSYSGLDKVEIESASCGDIVAIAGIPDVNIGSTIADIQTPIALPLIDIEQPTIKMLFKINDSPFAGKEGEYTTSRQIGERLHKELETDVALNITDLGPSLWEVAGRGELHLAILIEKMRREGFEFQVGRPQVVNKEIDGVELTPFERVYIEIPENFSGTVIQALGSRKGELTHMNTENKITYLNYTIPTKGLLGYRSQFMTETKGMGIMNSSFFEYRKDPGSWAERNQGSLVACETGTTRLYGMLNIQDRGTLFMGPAIEVYKGQIVGQSNRSLDLRVNVCREKELSNMRSKNDGGMEGFSTPRLMDLEDSLEYIGDDELVEVTPKSVRMRKMILDELEEKKQKMLSRFKDTQR